MINANELRIGNLVTWPGIDKSDVRYMKVTKLKAKLIDDWFEHQIEAIPLTPEILVAAGFPFNKELDGWEIKTPYHIEKRETTFEWYFITTFKKDWQIGGKIQYLHQLQNLYFALTGQELEYKP